MQFDVPQVVGGRRRLAHRATDDPPQPVAGTADAQPLGRHADRSAGAESWDTAAGNAESPLGIRPFEAYSFAAVPFAVRLAATPAAARVSAAVQTVLKLSEFQSSLESRIKFDVQGRPVYRLQMLLPEDFRLDHVSAPGDFQYAVTRQDKRPLLTIYLAAGQQGDVPVLIRGQLNCGAGVACTCSRMRPARKLPSNGAVPFPLPRLSILGVDRQQGDVAVQARSGVRRGARATGQLRARAVGSTVRLARRPAAPRYPAGTALRPGRLRRPVAAAAPAARGRVRHVSNVRVTDRAIEETILLDFDVQNAGIRRLSFLLPGWMAGSRISVPMLRQKTVEPVSKEPGAPLRVTIELQDDAIGQLRVLVENDRLLTPGSHEVPIPVVERRTNGRANGDCPLFPHEPPLRDDRERRTRRSGGRGGQAARDGRAGPAAEAVGDAQGGSGPRDDDGLSGLARRPAAAAELPHAIARRRGDGQGPHRPGRNHAGASTPPGPIAGNWPCGWTTPPSSSWKSGCPRADGCGRPAWPASRSSRPRSPARPTRAACGFR